MAQPVKMKTLENMSDIPQWVIVDGHEYTLPEYGVLDFRLQVAQAFLEDRGRWVREYEPIRLPDPKPGEATVWIANMTGNPFLPETLTDVRVTRGKEEEIEVPNPLRRPFTVQHVMHGDQVIRQCRMDPTSMESINLPPTVVKVPPFRRFRVGSVLGDWLIRRDRQQVAIAVGQLQYACEPRPFEAQPHWDIDDLQTYARIIDRKRFTSDDPQFGDLMTRSVRDYESEHAAAEAATQLWRAIWFRILDERYGNVRQQDMELFRQKPTKGATAPEVKKKTLAERLQERSEATV